MNKFELICELSRQQGLTRTESAKVVDLVFDQISQALECGCRVEIRGLWTFNIKNYSGYSGRNPRSGETIFVEPKKLPVFRPCTDLKKRVGGD